MCFLIALYMELGRKIGIKSPKIGMPTVVLRKSMPYTGSTVSGRDTKKSIKPKSGLCSFVFSDPPYCEFPPLQISLLALWY